MPSRGAAQLKRISVELSHQASPRGYRARLRRDITKAVLPMKKQVQANAMAIPAAGPDSTGLRAALKRATRIQINTGTRNVVVRLMVDGRRMPAGQQALPQLVEGERKWRHPVYPHVGQTRDQWTWVAQASHPIVAPAIPQHLPAVAAGVSRSLDVTANILRRA